MLKKLLKIVCCVMCLIAVSSQAALKIDITGAQSEPMPLAFPYLTTENPAFQSLAEQISEVIAQDLESSGLFRIVNREAYIQQMQGVDTRPQFADWQAIQAHALAYGQIEEELNGQLKVSFRLWDVFAQKQMDARVMTGEIGAWRKMAHIIADTIYERLTGERGYFDTKIVFISESGGQRNRLRRLAIMDHDGENMQYLSDGKDIVLTPRFSPNMKEITYLSYENGMPQVYLMNIQTLESRLLGRFDGMSFAPRFSPNGRYLIMSLAERGNSDIYTYDLRTQARVRLTTHPAIDTSPSFSPDGKQIVFNSDRGGNQQLYVMNADGSNVRRISFGEGTYATPVWSPRGDYIAFTKIKEGEFHIGLMRPDGSGERLIAKGFLVEAPTWAPNGRRLIYFKQSPSDAEGEGGTSRLYSIDVTGHHERLVPTLTEASDPTWSPLLHE